MKGDGPKGTAQTLEIKIVYRNDVLYSPVFAALKRPVGNRFAGAVTGTAAYKRQERGGKMQAKQYLQELKRLDTCISHKLQEKQAMYTSTVGAVRTDRERARASTGTDALPDLIARIEDMEQEIDRQLDAYLWLKHRIINQIHGLGNEAHISLLHKRYVKFKQLEEIAAEMNYTYSYARALHGKALAEFERRFVAEIANYQIPYTIVHADVL